MTGHVKWMIQIPRLCNIFMGKAYANFGELMANIFQPMFEATLYPSRHPEIYGESFLYFYFLFFFFLFCPLGFLSFFCCCAVENTAVYSSTKPRDINSLSHTLSSLGLTLTRFFFLFFLFWWWGGGYGTYLEHTQHSISRPHWWH